MSRLFTLLLALTALTSSAATLRGTVIGPDGEPPKWALVEAVPMAPMASTRDRTRVEEGRFTIPLGVGAHRVRIYSPWLATTELAVWITKPSETIDVQVAMPRDRVLPARGVAMVRGEWTDFKKLEPMEPTADGKFVYRGTSAEARVHYYIERDTAAGPDRDPNPGDPRVEIMEHRFVSVADVRDGKFEIRFDPSQAIERAEQDPATIRFLERPDLQAAHEVFAAQQRLYADVRYLIDVKGIPRDQRSPEIEQVSAAQQKWLQARVSRGPRLARQVAAALVLKSTWDKPKRKRLLALLPETAPGWAVALPINEEGWMLGAVLPPKDEAEHLAFAARIARVHPDPAVRAVSLMGLANRAKEAGDEKLEAKYLQQLKHAHSDTEFVKWWLERRNQRPIALTVGKPFPSTDLKTTRGTAIDASYFSGAKLTMVVFSSPGCGSCRMMLPSARTLRKTYAPDQLRIVTFHAGMTPKLVDHDVSVEPQPWDHVVLGEDEHPLEKACDVRGFPTVLLVRPDGTVVNRDEGLWANLERIVPNYLPLIPR